MADCTPAGDKEILFIRHTYPSTDPSLTWDYEQKLLSVGGKVAASSDISTSSMIEGSVIVPRALGTGSFNFTPPAGYGGLVYRGGSTFYYWDDSLHSWQPADLGGGVSSATEIIAGHGLTGGGPLVGDVMLSVVDGSTVQMVNVAGNNIVSSTRSTINFRNTASISWSIVDQGGFANITANIAGQGGGAWTSNTDAAGFGIINLSSINGIPMPGGFVTNPFNRDVSGNNFNLVNVNNGAFNTLSVATQITYKGLPIEDYFGQGSGDLWTENANGSIYRNSNVFINGSGSPLSVASSNNQNFLYMDVNGSGAEWAAFAPRYQGATMGELGFNRTTVELWSTSALIFRGYNANGAIYFPGNVGIGLTNPVYSLDVVTSGAVAARLSNNTATNNNVQLRFRGARNNTDLWALGTDLQGSGDAGFNFFDLVGSVIPLYLQSNTGRVGIGTTNPGQKLEVDGNILIKAAIPQLQFSGTETSAANFGIYEYQGALNFDWTGNRTIMTMLTNGDVGIGTLNPGYLLDVVGTAHFVSALFKPTTGDLTVLFQDGVPSSTTTLTQSASLLKLSNNALPVEFDANTNAGVSHQLYLAASGNVGIGLANPNQQLSVLRSTGLGTILGLGANSVQDLIQFGYNTSSQCFIQAAGFGPFVISATSNQSVILQPSGGNVGIGTISPPAILSVHVGANENLWVQAGQVLAGSLALSAGNDAGSANTPLEVRATHTMVIGSMSVGTAGGYSQTGGDLTVSRNNNPNTGAIFFGNSGGTYLFFDGTQFNFDKPLSISGGLTVSSGGATITGNSNITGQYLINGVPFTGGISTTTGNVVGSRSLGTNYFNGTNRPMFVSMSFNSNNSTNYAIAYSDTTATPTQPVAQAGPNGGYAQAYSQISFWVMPNNYYRIQPQGSLVNANMVQWVEWY